MCCVPYTASLVLSDGRGLALSKYGVWGLQKDVRPSCIVCVRLLDLRGALVRCLLLFGSSPLFQRRALLPCHFLGRLRVIISIREKRHYFAERLNISLHFEFTILDI